MPEISYPVIDLTATGKNICRLRRAKGLTVRQLQHFFGFEEPQAIYQWQSGRHLPSVDNLYALSTLLGVPMNEILVSQAPKPHKKVSEQQAEPCCSALFPAIPDTASVRCSFHHFAASRRRRRTGARSTGKRTGPIRF